MKWEKPFVIVIVIVFIFILFFIFIFVFILVLFVTTLHNCALSHKETALDRERLSFIQYYPGTIPFSNLMYSSA